MEGKEALGESLCAVLGYYGQRRTIGYSKEAPKVIENQEQELSRNS